MNPGTVKSGSEFRQSQSWQADGAMKRGDMRDGQPLRFYASPGKVLLLVLGSAAFVAIGVWMLRTPGISAKPFNVFIAWAAIVFFGFGAIVFLITAIQEVLLRRPVLQVDQQGWFFRPALFARKQAANWRNIERVALCRQQLGQARSMYYLIIHGANSDKGTLRTRFATRFYPAMAGALMVVPLNSLFVRTTPKKVERILERICATYAHELRSYGIQVDAEVQPL